MNIQPQGIIIPLCFLFCIPTLSERRSVTPQVAHMLQETLKRPFSQKVRTLQQLLRLAETDSATYRNVARQCDSLLYEYDSPYRNDSLYIIALRHRIASRRFSQEGKKTAALRLRQLRANRPGHHAADFTLYLREGRQLKFAQTADSTVTLLILFDPDCRRCQFLVAELNKDKRFKALLADKQLNIVAIDVSTDKPTWEMIKNDLPQTWTAGFAVSDNIITDYDIRVFPSVYLLDKRRRVAFHGNNIDNLLPNVLKLLSKDKLLYQKN